MDEIKQKYLGLLSLMCDYADYIKPSLKEEFEESFEQALEDATTLVPGLKWAKHDDSGYEIFFE